RSTSPCAPPSMKCSAKRLAHHQPSPAPRERVASATSRVRVPQEINPHPPIAPRWAPPSPAMRERVDTRVCTARVAAHISRTMSTLFESQAPHPLADRLRPRHLSEIVGQDHLLGLEGPIGRMVGSGQLASMILWGPPGCGKTTIARLLP